MHVICDSDVLNEKDGHGIKLMDFSLQEEGGKFIAHNEIRNYLSGVIKCVSNFVKFGDGRNRFTDFDSVVYKLVPEMFIDIANNSRIDSGYRLLMRSVRHAMDSKSVAIDMARFVLSPEGKVIMILQNQVPASMKSIIYHTKCAIDEDGVLVACECDCQSGSEKNETHLKIEKPIANFENQWRTLRNWKTVREI